MAFQQPDLLVAERNGLVLGRLLEPHQTLIPGSELVPHPHAMHA